MSSSSNQPRGWAQALARAAESGDVLRVEELLAGGAPADARLEGGATALMRAAARGYEDVAGVLLDAGADVNARRGDGFTPLVLAVFFGHYEVVRLLLERSADASARTRLGVSARDWAASRGFKGIGELLKNAPERPQPKAPASRRAAPDPEGLAAAAGRPAQLPVRGDSRAADAARRVAPAGGIVVTPDDIFKKETGAPPPGVGLETEAAARAAGTDGRATLADEAPSYEPRFETPARGFAGSWQASAGVVLLVAAVALSAFAVWQNTRRAGDTARPQPSPSPAAQAAQPLPTPSVEITPQPQASPLLDPLMQGVPGGVVVQPYPFEQPPPFTPDAAGAGAGASASAPSVVTESDPTPAEAAPPRETRNPRAEAPPSATPDEPRRSGEAPPEDAGRRERPPAPESRATPATPDPSATPRRRVIQWPPQEK